MDPDENITLPRGSGLNLTCTATAGYPIPTLVWLENEKPIFEENAKDPVPDPDLLGNDQNSDFNAKDPNQVVTKFLSIPSLFEATKFSCVAENSKGEAQRHVFVNVRGIAIIFK